MGGGEIGEAERAKGLAEASSAIFYPPSMAQKPHTGLLGLLQAK